MTNSLLIIISFGPFSFCWRYIALYVVLLHTLPLADGINSHLFKRGIFETISHVKNSSSLTFAKEVFFSILLKRIWASSLCFSEYLASVFAHSSGYMLNKYFAQATNPLTIQEAKMPEYLEFEAFNH